MEAVGDSLFGLQKLLKKILAGPDISKPYTNPSVRTLPAKSVYDSVQIVIAAENAARRTLNRPHCGGQSPGTRYRDH